ncbi:hypothetical protein SAMN06265373_103317 [Shimia sagamensis]|uniref:Lipoprotein n=2 Tax=Shimia sagamensis TaxID=1566352 RepID=A0ABY1NV32_9RHOB|nr:hypothetical protein SAMN06265373_103317 [Shimia sagamensis]
MIPPSATYSWKFSREPVIVWLSTTKHRLKDEMSKYLVSAIFLSLSLSACSTADPKNRYSVTYGKTEVFWSDLLEVSNLERSSFNLSADESLYIATAVTSLDVAVSMGNGKTASTVAQCAEHSTDYSGRKTINAGTPNQINVGVPKMDSKKYMDCEQRLKKAKYKENNRSFEELIALAERAVRDDGRCEWSGYDKSFDQFARARGSLARMDDTRMFFAKMSCPAH